LQSSVNRDFRTYASDEGKNCQHVSLVRVKKRRYLLYCCSDMFWKGHRCELDLYRIRWRVSWNYIGSPFQVVFNNRHVFDVHSDLFLGQFLVKPKFISGFKAMNVNKATRIIKLSALSTKNNIFSGCRGSRDERIVKQSGDRFRFRDILIQVQAIVHT